MIDKKFTLVRIWSDYKSEVIFGLVLFVASVLSYWLATFIPESFFEYFINPMEYIITATVCFFGAVLLLSHKGRNAIRRSWARVLIVWGCIDVLAVLMRYVLDIKAIGGTPDDPLFNASVTLGNVMAWQLFIYPSQVLRPGWLNWWRALLLVLPMIVLGVVDYFMPANLLPFIMLYPAVIFVMLCRHIRTYRRWCEDNFSTMDDIDVQWIVRYLTMLAIAGMAFYFIVFCYLPNRMFTQQWTLLLILAYTTQRVLFRPDPWQMIRSVAEPQPEAIPEQETDATPVSEADEQTETVYRTKLEDWLATDKPYLNPDFQLTDLRQVLPLNRSYLSRFINSEYGCSFYQWVNRQRIEEAKRLMTEQPELKIQDVAERCGFSSRSVFTQVFSREIGVTPSKWITAKRE